MVAPSLTPEPEAFKTVAAGHRHAFAVDVESGFACWGDGDVLEVPAHELPDDFLAMAVAAALSVARRIYAGHAAGQKEQASHSPGERAFRRPWTLFRRQQQEEERSHVPRAAVPILVAVTGHTSAGSDCAEPPEIWRQPGEAPVAPAGAGAVGRLDKFVSRQQRANKEFSGGYHPKLFDSEESHVLVAEYIKCFLNGSPDEVIRGLFYNKHNDSLITVSVHGSENFIWCLV